MPSRSSKFKLNQTRSTDLGKACGISENIYRQFFSCLTLVNTIFHEAGISWLKVKGFWKAFLNKKLYLINTNVEFWFHVGDRPVDKIVSLITLVIILN